MPNIAVTLRMDPELHRKVKAIAKRRGVTLTGFVHSLLEKVVQESEEQELYEAFSLVSEETEASSVEFAAHAHQEVVRR